MPRVEMPRVVEIHDEFVYHKRFKDLLYGTKGKSVSCPMHKSACHVHCASIAFVGVEDVIEVHCNLFAEIVGIIEKESEG